MFVNIVDLSVNVVICLIVIGAMVYILIRFFRRLKQIEIERWGNMSRPQGDGSMMDTIKWLMKKKDKTKK